MRRKTRLLQMIPHLGLCHLLRHFLHWRTICEIYSNHYKRLRLHALHPYNCVLYRHSIRLPCTSIPLAISASVVCGRPISGTLIRLVSDEHSFHALVERDGVGNPPPRSAWTGESTFPYCFCLPFGGGFFH